MCTDRQTKRDPRPANTRRRQRRTETLPLDQHRGLRRRTGKLPRGGPMPAVGQHDRRHQIAQQPRQRSRTTTQQAGMNHAERRTDDTLRGQRRQLAARFHTRAAPIDSPLKNPEHLRHDAQAPAGPRRGPPRTPAGAARAHDRGTPAALRGLHEYAPPTPSHPPTRGARPPQAPRRRGQTPRENNLHGRRTGHRTSYSKHPHGQRPGAPSSADTHPQPRQRTPRRAAAHAATRSRTRHHHGDPAYRDAASAHAQPAAISSHPPHTTVRHENAKTRGHSREQSQLEDGEGRQNRRRN